jgi:Asp-tRNA(Asn)/Glu-tRNA(Gln) amidotransferase A subunit family amidase
VIENPFALTATEASKLMEAGRLSAETLVRSCLERIESDDRRIHAWAHIDHARAIDVARRADSMPRRSRLHGIPVGFKDVIDTADLPTAYGSPIYRSHRPPVDAACVSLSREAGMVPIGKTATTEFAYRHPSACANPHNPRHSPGGSSSGSAAAVAASMIPLAVGTQTAGSVIRPASYCGVHAIKPGFGEVSFAGVRHLSETLDTLGWMARSLEDLALFGSVLQLSPWRAVGEGIDRPPRLAVYRTAFRDEMQPAARKRFEEMVAALARAGARMTDIDLSDLDRQLLDACWTVTKFEGGRLLLSEAREHPDALSPAATQLVLEARAIGLDAYHAARQRIEQGRKLLADRLSDVDATITPSSAGEAPASLDDTGPVIFNFLWTLAYLPALNLPVATGDSGLPIGLQVVGARHGEQDLLAIGRWIEKRLS